MIPKIIHYCWFGGNELNDLAKMCIASWKKFCPDYEIIEWNESNFDINSNPYVKEAYERKKYAFVTDYVRLLVLKEYGGIYMDTDVELIKNIDAFLNNKAFSGFENETQIQTAIMGSEKNNEWIDYLLSYYDDRYFIKENGSIDYKTNVVTITQMTKKKYDILLNNTYQKVEDTFTIYPRDYFCPKDYKTGNINLTDNSACIHHFDGSWETVHQKEIRDLEVKANKKYPDNKDKARKYFRFVSKIVTIKYMIKEKSYVQTIGYVIKKFKK